MLTLSPPVEYYSIDNRVRTVAAGGERRIRVDRMPGSMELQVWGTIPLRDHGQDSALGIDDPALYAAKAFRQLLGQRGVTIEGSAVARHLYPYELASPTQAPEPAAETGAGTGAPHLGCHSSKTCGSPTR